MGAAVALLSAPRSRWFALLALVGAAVAVPASLAFSGGICTGCEGASSAPAGDFEKFGCTACHGEHLKFPSVNTSDVSVQVAGAEGAPLNGPYLAKGIYTITITLAETNNPAGTNHAGFNLRAAAGKLTAVEGQSQVSTDAKQATHTGPGRTSWQVGWEAPDTGAAGFSLFVNDVDGDASASEGDQVRWLQFGFADHDGAVLGAAAEEHVEFGISLQQYWIGLIGLAGMIFVMVAGFVYLKFVNPNNTDQKDR